MAHHQTHVQPTPARGSTGFHRNRVRSQRGEGIRQRVRAARSACVRAIVVGGRRARHEPMARPRRLGRRLPVRDGDAGADFRLLRNARLPTRHAEMWWCRPRLQRVRVRARSRRALRSVSGSRMAIQDDLIFDVGAHNGDDTGYYLEKGYRVVAVEANPLLAQSMTARFEAAIDAGRLTVLNVGIAQESGTLPFWVNDDNSVWSSFDREVGGRHGSRCHAIDIECVSLDALIRQFGAPHYLKIDIEGYDRICLDALQPSACPRYIS